MFDEVILEKLAVVASEKLNRMDELRRALEDCLNLLPPAQRQLVDLRYASGQAIDAIAESIGRPVGSIRQTLYRILLAEEVGADSIKELVDLIAEPNSTEATSPIVRADSLQDWRWSLPETFWKRMTWALATAAVVAIALLLGRGDGSAFANASNVVRDALVALH